MRKYDAIVIGGGLAGLTAAAVAAKRGKKVLVMAKGVGTIAIGGGSIDILGYKKNGSPVGNPAIGLARLGAGHPYSKIGRQGVTAAFQYFINLATEEGYPYSGSLDKTQWLPTAVGTLKPSCLTPRTMDTADLKSADRIVVAGFKGLKDYFPELIVRGLGQISGYNKQYSIVMLETNLAGHRDLTALDIARWLDKEEDRQACIKEMRKVIPPGSVVLLPPVLGTRPDYQAAEELEKGTACRFIETTGLPPAVTGFRLRNMLLNRLKKLGVKIIEQANVVRAVVEEGRCLGVVTGNVDRERTYDAAAFILATGGFFGGGLVAGVDRAWETIFNLPVEVPANREEWSNPSLFSTGEQLFASFGLNVDSQLRPVDSRGAVVLKNVYIVGRSLGGYDYCFEKSGNGVAIASGYHAGMSV